MNNFGIRYSNFEFLKLLKPVKLAHASFGSQGGKPMRAMLLHELGGPVTFHEVDEPRVGPSEAKIRVRAAGVGLTIIIMKNTPGLVTRYPRILGHEVAGEVVESRE